MVACYFQENKSIFEVEPKTEALGVLVDGLSRLNVPESLFLFPQKVGVLLVGNEEKSLKITFEVVGLPLGACKPKTVVTMTLHSPRTLPGLFVHPTWGSVFSAEHFCFAFVVPLHIVFPSQPL